MNIGFIIPYVDHFESMGFPESYDLRCDFSVMSSRFYHAAEGRKIICRSDFPSPDEEIQYFLYDYFLLKHPAWGKCLPDPPCQSNINIISECFDINSRAWNVRHVNCKKKYALNPVCPNYLLNFNSFDFSISDLIEKFNNELYKTIPLGTLHSLCEKETIKEKILILDEPHSKTLNDLEKTNKQHVFSYQKSIEICKILNKRGWKIVSFCTRDKLNKFLNIKKLYPFIEFKEFKKVWVPYLEMLNLYKSSTLFFNHYQETHGFSVYENLQMGNGVIVFSENFNPLSLSQFQNGCILSLRMGNEICADLIEEFYEKLDPKLISNDAYQRFSSDTFVKRFLKIIDQEKNYLFKM